jgi:hypothetical protein
MAVKIASPPAGTGSGDATSVSERSAGVAGGAGTFSVTRLAKMSRPRPAVNRKSCQCTTAPPALSVSKPGPTI